MPGQFLGYSLQTTRCLARLLAAPPGSRVSVEDVDDVGVRCPDGSTVAEQSKSAREWNPVSDRNPELWKTFDNWIEAVRSGDLDAATTSFEIFVTPPRSGHFVSILHDARTSDEAEAAIATVRSQLWGDGPAFPGRSDLPRPLARHVNHVLASEELFATIIPRFQLLSSADLYGDLRTELQKWYPCDAVDDILRFALGWVKEAIDRPIERGRPAVVEADVFRVQLFGYVRRTDPQRVLRCFAQNPTAEHIDAERAVRTYIKQLALVGCDHDDQVDAVIDFFRAAANRTAWSARGYVNAADISDYEARLKQAWRNLRRKEFAALQQVDDEAKGRALLSDCLLFPCAMTGAELPDGFTRGSFHALADSLEVGWHPDYEKRLGKGRA